MKLTRLLAGTAIAGSSLFAFPAFAQDGPTSAQCAEQPNLQGCEQVDEGPNSDTQIVITGSRIARPNLKSAVPIITVEPAQVTERGDISLGDALSQLPAMRSTFTQSTSIGAIGTAGLSILDLRGLGTARTLVLVNGRRRVTAQPGVYSVDVNTIPSDLLERVDVVTGGNSAVYGSDAIAGVVNFIIKRDFDGVRLSGQAGTSTYGDRGNYSLGIVAGRNFADGRLNITGSFEYGKAQPLFFSERDYLGAYTGVPGFITSQITTAPNRNFDGIPNTTFADGNPGITFGNISLGGYIATACPTAGTPSATPQRVAALCTGRTTPTGGLIPYNYAFLPGGQLVRDDESRGLSDNRAIGGGVLGGLSASGVEDAMLYPGLTSYKGNLFINAELSSGFKPFVELTYVRINATQQSTQPTFVSGAPLVATFRTDNPFLSAQAQTTLGIITNGGATFNMLRFNNDFGTRAEQHKRQTYIGSIGARGDLSTKGNLRYEVALSFGKTDTYYETGGNVDTAKFNRASNAVLAPGAFTGTNFVLNGSGQRVVCAVNADANPANDDPACYPLNLFGFGSPDQRAKDYVLVTSSREQWAKQFNAIAFISGDTSGFFELPGGPVGFAVGLEYRKESAYSAFDAFTRSGATFLNSSTPFDPPSLEVKEAFAELRIPIIADRPFFNELSIEGAGRVSDYGGNTGAVWAYNAGLIWAPIEDLRFRASYGKSVRSPNLSNLFATAAETFATVTDPCDQPGGTNAANNITANPNRAANCAAAGIPTTITYTQSDSTVVVRPWTNVPGSTISGTNGGNPDLVPEIGKSLTVGFVFQPKLVPGLAISVDYYRINVNNVISGLTGQQIINRCYDDPTGIDNIFCDAISRRTSPNSVENLTFSGQQSRRLTGIIGDVPLAKIGSSFLNAPYNFAALKTAGIDADISYRHKFDNGIGISLRGIVSYLIRRDSFSYIAEPGRSDRFRLTLGDPAWAASFNANIDFGNFDFSYNMRLVGKQIVSGLTYETFFTHQGRGPTNPDARPFVYNPIITYHSFRANWKVNKEYRFFVGVDNAFNRLPPYELTGTGNDAIYPALGRYFYAGFKAEF